MGQSNGHSIRRIMRQISATKLKQGLDCSCDRFLAHGTTASNDPLHLGWRDLEHRYIVPRDRSEKGTTCFAELDGRCRVRAAECLLNHANIGFEITDEVEQGCMEQTESCMDWQIERRPEDTGISHAKVSRRQRPLGASDEKAEADDPRSRIDPENTTGSDPPRSPGRVHVFLGNHSSHYASNHGC